MPVEFSVINPFCHASVPACLPLPPSIHPSIHPAVHPFTSTSPFPRLANWFRWAHGKRQPLGTNIETPVCQAFCFNEKLKPQQSHLHSHRKPSYMLPHIQTGTHYVHTLQRGQIWVHNYLCCLDSRWHLTSAVTTLFVCWMEDLCWNVNPAFWQEWVLAVTIRSLVCK